MIKQKKQKIFLIGIAGVGMSALATLLVQMGHEVGGSDQDEQFITDKMLTQAGIKRAFGYSAENISLFAPDLVIVGAALNSANPEVDYTKKQKLDHMLYSEAVSKFTAHQQTIAVSGVHGKTTTTAMLAYVMEKLQLNPSYLIGCASVPGLASNAHYSGGNWFVMEADEYKKSVENDEPKLVDIKPQIAIITAIEWDHPDVYTTESYLYHAFYRFACSVARQGVIVANIDSPKVLKLVNSLADRRYITYGFDKRANWQIVNWQQDETSNSFELKIDGKIQMKFEIALSGKHNVYNAVAVIATAHLAGARLEAIAKILPQFKGVERRFQILGKYRGAVIIDDYAHHPTAIKMTLEAAATRYPSRRIVAVFQPHTFSRTKALLDDFSNAFAKADVVIITDIFASAREKSGGIHARHLVFEVKQKHQKVHYVPSIDEVTEFIRANFDEDDLILTIGAGDVYKVGEMLLNSNQS